MSNFFDDNKDSKREMSEKEAPEAPRTKGSSLKSYASRVFQESSVGMVSSLAHTASIRRRIFKVFALLVCLTGFLYQTGQFLAVVFRYPTSVDIDVIRPNEFTVPGYTFCDNNGISRRKFCQKFPEHCEVPDEALCEAFEYYCDEERSLVPKKEYYSLNSGLTYEELIDLNVNATEFVHGYIEEEITGPYFRKTDISAPSYICYSLNERVNNALMPSVHKKEEFFRKPATVIEFDIRSDEVFVPGTRAGIIFAIHSPFQAVDPFLNGIFLKPGRTYKVFVSMDEEILLQEPYDTNCVNYTEIWEKNGFSGPRLQDMCKQNCIAEISLKCFNCIVPVILFPRTEKLCTPADVEGKDNCPPNVLQLVEECKMDCRDDCRRTKYTYTIQERYTPIAGIHMDSESSISEIKKDMESTIRVEVFLEGDEIVVLKHSPKYMIVEVFSNIGGFIGCWLGINLLDITDIFEGFFRIFRYSFKRR